MVADWSLPAMPGLPIRLIVIILVTEEIKAGKSYLAGKAFSTIRPFSPSGGAALASATFLPPMALGLAELNESYWVFKVSIVSRLDLSCLTASFLALRT